jgi:hypothetical protein
MVCKMKRQQEAYKAVQEIAGLEEILFHDCILELGAYSLQVQ